MCPQWSDTTLSDELGPRQPGRPVEVREIRKTVVYVDYEDPQDAEEEAIAMAENGEIAFPTDEAPDYEAEAI